MTCLALTPKLGLLGPPNPSSLHFPRELTLPLGTHCFDPISSLVNYPFFPLQILG